MIGGAAPLAAQIPRLMCTAGWRNGVRRSEAKMHSFNAVTSYG